MRTERQVMSALRRLAKADDQGDLALVELDGLAAKVRAVLPGAPHVPSAVPSWGILLHLAQEDGALKRWMSARGSGSVE